MRRRRTPDRTHRLTARPSLIPILTFLVALLSAAFLSAPAYAGSPANDGYGTVDIWSTMGLGDVLTDGYYYSDDWFSQDPKERNDALALASMQLVASAVDDDPEGTAATYLRGLGFDEVGFEGFNTDDPIDFAYTWGRKTVNGDTLYVIAVQSYSFDAGTKLKGWTQNFMVNGDPTGDDKDATSGEHYAFSHAVERMSQSIMALSGSRPAKYWICGQSRGGAIANILAARLPRLLSMAGAQSKGIYAYTFEAPMVADGNLVQNADACDYIHNYRCDNDIVPKVPMWGMQLYGNTYDLRTDETDAKVKSELKRLGSQGAVDDPPMGTDRMDMLMSALEAKVPTRADYSLLRTDSFVDGTGTHSITYSYQGMLCDLMGMTFGGELGGLSTDTILDEIGDLLPSCRALAAAVVCEASDDEVGAVPLYWEAACGLRSTISAWVGHDVSMSDESFYALLRLIGPIGVNPTWEEDPDPESNYKNVAGYLDPLMTLALGSGAMTYSHHFDTLVARLHAFSPMDKVDDQDLHIERPAVGDSTNKAPGEVAASFSGQNGSWASADATWLTESETIEDDSIQYLRVEFRAIAHDIDGDWDVTIDGQSPVNIPSVKYENGVSTATVTWEFKFGNPADMTVSFDVAGHGATPHQMAFKKGTMLRYEDGPQMPETVTEDGIIWKFGGWYDENGTIWDDLRVDSDMTLHARWIQVVKSVELTFPDIEVGKVPTVSVPEGTPYHATIDYISNSEWDTVEGIDSAGCYHLNVIVAVNDPDAAMFLVEGSEEDGYSYAGTLVVNGETYEGLSYDPEYGTLQLTHDCEATDKGTEPVNPQGGGDNPKPESGDSTPVENTLYRFVQGDGQQWHRKSGRFATFVVKRSADDERTHDLFTGVVLGGASIKGDAYEVESGSLILKLRPEYLDTLATGRYRLTVRFQDGEATAFFKIEDAEEEKSIPATGTADSKKDDGRATSKWALPKMGDDSPVTLLIGLGALGASLLLVGYAVRKRDGK